MRKSKYSFSLLAALMLCLLFLPGRGWAQVQTENHAKVTIKLSKDEELKPGDELEIVVEVAPVDHWHVYSAKPSPTFSYRETLMELDSTKSSGVEIVGPLTEEGEMSSDYDELMGGDLNYYKGTVIFTQKIKVTGEDPKIAGLIEYQACSGQKCIFPYWEFEF